MSSSPWAPAGQGANFGRMLWARELSGFGSCEGARPAFLRYIVIPFGKLYFPSGSIKKGTASGKCDQLLDVLRVSVSAPVGSANIGYLIFFDRI